MFKDIINPVQSWLLSEGRCSGCGKPFERGKRRKRENGIEKLSCQCGRIFSHNLKTKKYY